MTEWVKIRKYSVRHKDLNHSMSHSSGKITFALAWCYTSFLLLNRSQYAVDKGTTRVTTCMAISKCSDVTVHELTSTIYISMALTSSSYQTWQPISKTQNTSNNDLRVGWEMFLVEVASCANIHFAVKSISALNFYYRDICCVNCSLLRRLNGVLLYTHWLLFCPNDAPVLQSAV